MLSRTAALIHEKFAVTSEQAHEEAKGLLSLIESKGGNASSWHMIVELVEKQLGKRLEWRSPQEKQEAEQRKAETAASYNAHIDSIRASWLRKPT